MRATPRDTVKEIASVVFDTPCGVCPIGLSVLVEDGVDDVKVVEVSVMVPVMDDGIDFDDISGESLDAVPSFEDGEICG